MLQTFATNPAPVIVNEARQSMDTSAQALSDLGLRKLKGELDKIHDIVLAAARHGIDDMSGREIQQRYELIYGKRIDSGTVSARVKNLVDGRRLQRRIMTRACQVTGHDIHPVCVVATQVRLVA